MAPSGEESEGAVLPASSKPGTRRASLAAMDSLGADEGLYASQLLLGGQESWNVRIRQRSRGATAAPVGLPPQRRPPKAACKNSEARMARFKDVLNGTVAQKLPESKATMAALLQKRFTDREDWQVISVALHAAVSVLPEERWPFRQAVLKALVSKMGGDARMVAALLLHDLDDCLSVPWGVVAEALRECAVLGEEVVVIIEEKKRIEQLGLLLYLGALSEGATRARPGPGNNNTKHAAAAQVLRMLYLHGSQDFRGALLDIAEVNQMLWDESQRARACGNLELPAEGRALARCALDLHAPLAHGLGMTQLGSSGRSNHLDERLTPTMEQLALRLLFPTEYRSIEEWMLREESLLNRTLQRCMHEVRMCLKGDDDFNSLAGFKIHGRVKSVFSLVKKLLQQRGESLFDLKAEAVKDLLALEVVVTPDPKAEVPKNPEQLVDEWRERAACFAALDVLQRYAKGTAGWWVLPGSTKDYITKSKKSGYRALHITLGTNVRAMLPRASSRNMQAMRMDTTMSCKLEVHIFSDTMKEKERAGSASHNLYKAFEMNTDEVFTALGTGAAACIAPSTLREVVFPAEKMRLWGEIFNGAYIDKEFGPLCMGVDRSQSGSLTFDEIDGACQKVCHRLEGFRYALERRKDNWWLQGVHAPALSPEVFGGHLQAAGRFGAEEKLAMLDDALRICKEAHAGQRRKSGEPYWTHPLAVADILAQLLLPPVMGELLMETGDPEMDQEYNAKARWRLVAQGPEDVFAMYIAALLHDTVEDTTMTVSQIAERFGECVAKLVDGVTKASCAECYSTGPDGTEAKRPVQDAASKTAQDLRKVLARAANDVRVLVVKFADRLHNMRTLQHMPAHKQIRISDETNSVYVPLAERLGMHVWKTELEDLCYRYLNAGKYEAVMERNNGTKIARERNLRYIQQYISTLFVDWTANKSVVAIDVTEEPVHTQLQRWMAQNNGQGSGPPDRLPRVKIVMTERASCWECLGRIHALVPPMPNQLRDYISSPKENLYMSLHTTVLMDGAPLKVCIQSKEMQWVSDLGVGAHWRHSKDLLQTDMGRILRDALHSTWLREANDSLEHSLSNVMAPLTNRESGERDASAGRGLDAEEDVPGRPDLREVHPLLESVARVAQEALLDPEGRARAADLDGAIAATADAMAAWQVGRLESVHRAYSEALKENVAVFTPTGRVVYLPRDATALDFAVWNLGPRKGLLAEAVEIDGSPAPLCRRLREGQTVLLHLREGEPADAEPPPRVWSGIHIRYLRTSRARAAFVEQRTHLLGLHGRSPPWSSSATSSSSAGAGAGRRAAAALAEGRAALEEDLRLHGLEPGEFRDRLGDKVVVAVGRGALPVELVSAVLLQVHLHSIQERPIPLGDMGYEYAMCGLQGSPEAALARAMVISPTLPSSPAGATQAEDDRQVLSFLLVAVDRPGILSEVVQTMRRHAVDVQRLQLEHEPTGATGIGSPPLILITATVHTDCILRFGALLHGLRLGFEGNPAAAMATPDVHALVSENAPPLHVERVPAEMAEAMYHGGAAKVSSERGRRLLEYWLKGLRPGLNGHRHNSAPASDYTLSGTADKIHAQPDRLVFTSGQLARWRWQALNMTVPATTEDAELEAIVAAASTGAVLA
eukprot:TRINITY_DN45071_c0_g1_i1.p1 TRINITY_DN45071_c0_g1~~TRINITY_DN45071_c0_g1_i1.p1  ORF type:complete len:1866 (+),score=335.88 TRINITY_DN45071_c0_g1_i1:715-5598(+)